jgi:hypothetical protein
MSTLYSVRSSAVRAAKKVCGPDQEWTITQLGEGFTYIIMDIDAKQPEAPKEVTEVAAPEVTVESLDKQDAMLADIKVRLDALQDLAKTNKASAVKSTTVKPWQAAKVIISNAISQGVTGRKEIIALCVAAGINKNTADGAHYEMCVKK